MVRDLMRIFQRVLLVPLVLLFASAGAAWAEDPPSRVGRISVIDGELAVKRDGGKWESAGINWPITTDDSLATERNSRAEIRIGSSVLRLDEDTTVQIRRLDDERIRVRLDDGSVSLRVRSSDREDQIEVETRDGRAMTADPGRYRIDQLDRSTVVTNYRGHIDFRAPDRNIGVSDDRRMEISSDGRTDVSWSSPENDDFSDWAQARDERDERIGRPRHVSPEMTGYEDLYEYGEWGDYGDYGTVWYPRAVPAGWAPYRYGHWMFVQPWGWTWVDDQPWGFAPFHYGRWVLIRNRWAWAPGRYVARPVYAPALVAWIGAPGASITISSGLPRNVSWYPLAPREVFVPRYRYSPTYVRQVNITQVTNVTEITRVVQAPDRVRHVYRQEQFAVTPASERFVQTPRVVNIDPDRRREQRMADWERRRAERHDDRRDGDRRREGLRDQSGQPVPAGGPQIAPAIRERTEREQADQRQRERLQQPQQEQDDRQRRFQQREQTDQQRDQARRAEAEQRQRERQQQLQQDQDERQRRFQQREQADQQRQQQQQQDQEDRRRQLQQQRDQTEQQHEQARRAEFEQRQRERQQQQQDQEDRRRQLQQQHDQAEQQQRDQVRQQRTEFEQQRQRERQAQDQEQDRRREAAQQREQFDRQRERSVQPERREAQPQQRQGRGEEEKAREQQRKRQNNPNDNNHPDN
ncbi:MAG TPA: DUF6600 domain-containing protein [Aromatoleum sp.]|uniref:DUF6600 domain-containing protein n=1 Tax=Aromatoleum sp. TaxID=2307007 RepID=UPI002B45ED86|nr:DUF6600 domain-containing protein [Aromatoleum sp.]HJV24875.1 DUF6600 domain-containing protein [Aromatoleum sp.]